MVNPAWSSQRRDLISNPLQTLALWLLAFQTGRQRCLDCSSINARKYSGIPMRSDFARDHTQSLIKAIRAEGSTGRRSYATMKNKYAHLSKAPKPRDIDAPEAVKKVEPRNRTKYKYYGQGNIDPEDPFSYGFIDIGYVTGTHGVFGEMKVICDSDFASERLCQRGPVWLKRRNRNAPREMTIVRGRKGPGQDKYLLTLENVRSVQEAKILKGATLFVHRDLRPASAGDEVLNWEFEGFDVVLARQSDEAAGRKSSGNRRADSGAEPQYWIAGSHVGKVIGVVLGEGDLGQDILEVALGDGRDSSDTVLVPYEDEIVVDIRLDERKVLINPPEGLLELIQPKRKTRVVISGYLPYSG